MKCAVEDCYEKAEYFFYLVRKKDCAPIKIIRLEFYGEIIDLDEETERFIPNTLCLFHNDPAMYHKKSLEILGGI
jgi:hypothetical protein